MGGGYKKWFSFYWGMLTQKRLTRNQRVKRSTTIRQLIAGYFQMVANLDISVTAGHKMAALAVVFLRL